MKAIEGRPGYRLDRLELWNWGTFHEQAQVLDVGTGWALLVGDNGSGKSTAIDALRTLLVPPRLLNYNDAAADGKRGAGRDRTRRSYVRGAWASSSTIDSTAATTEYLRQAGVLSALAAVFSDGHGGSSVTVAQVLWEHDEQIKEIYAVSAARRGLKDLLEGHASTTDIRRAARRAAWELYDSFSAYSERFRALLHVPGDKALEVFNRAIGMKEVHDIDAFVRQFMLPSAETFAFIRDTVQPHYRTLLDCWSALVRAERQIALLRPVVSHSERLIASDRMAASWRRLQDLARPYLADCYMVILRDHAGNLESRLRSAEEAREAVVENLGVLRRERDQVNTAITSSDLGVRLKAIESELQQAEEARRNAQLRLRRVEPSIALLEAADCLSSAESFAQYRSDWEQRALSESLASERAEERRAGYKHDQMLALQAMIEAKDELESVERNRVNIPREFLVLRGRIAAAVGVLPDQLPFAGELVEVRESYAEWIGAIERLLRGFGLSLLVPEASYRAAAEFINSNWLGIRLFFHRVPARDLPPPDVSNDRVPGRLEFRTDHPLYLWVANEVANKFNHRCCDSIAELERAEFGLTKQGLVRHGTRHVKDDGRALDDHSARILGWSTNRKIAALRRLLVEAESRATAAARLAGVATGEAELARKLGSAARELLSVESFNAIDPVRWNERIMRLLAERTLLEQSSEQLRTLQDKLAELESSIVVQESTLSRTLEDIGGLRRDLESCAQRVKAIEGELSAFGEYNREETRLGLADVLSRLPVLAIDNLEQVRIAAQQSLQGHVTNEVRKSNEAQGKMVASMSEFLQEFPDFRQTLGVDREYADGFASTLDRIEGDDLPRHRERFEYYLNENLVGDLLMLNSRLDEHQEMIEERIGEINNALRDIDYGDDSFVQLRLANRAGQEVAEFRRSLKSCFEYGIAPAADERIRIFERVRALLESFQRDPESTQRVIDVRNWFAAGVRELRRSDDVEMNYYAATTGKSGGQKAKLAFTILASALSAQYGLSTSNDDAPNFRLVVIDEAFSRTDESNSTSAMQLFDKLGFQLLIVGPFDAKAKLAIPFVDSVHLATNPNGNASRLLALTREEAGAIADSRQNAASGVPPAEQRT